MLHIVLFNVGPGPAVCDNLNVNLQEVVGAKVVI